MFLSKLKGTILTLTLVGGLSAGAVVLAQRAESGGPPRPERDGDAAAPRLKFEIRTWKDGKETGAPVVVDATDGERTSYQVETPEAVIQIRPRALRGQFNQLLLRHALEEERAKIEELERLRRRIQQNEEMQRQLKELIKHQDQIQQNEEVQRQLEELIKQRQELIKQREDKAATKARNRVSPAPEPQQGPAMEPSMMMPGNMPGMGMGMMMPGAVKQATPPQPEPPKGGVDKRGVDRRRPRAPTPEENPPPTVSGTTPVPEGTPPPPGATPAQLNEPTPPQAGPRLDYDLKHRAAGQPGAAKLTLPRGIRGFVTAVDPGQTFGDIDFGSDDSGLIVGQKLYVYRNPAAPESIGKFLIMQTKPDQSVGKLIDAAPGRKLEVGDIVTVDEAEGPKPGKNRVTY